MSPALTKPADARQTPALLRGLIFGPDGRALSPTHTRRKGKLYRYQGNRTWILVDR